MTFALRKCIILHPTNIIAIAIVFGGSYVVSDGIVSPQVKDASSATFQILRLIDVCYVSFIFAVLIGTVISLVGRRWYSAACYFLTTCTAYVSMTGTAALNDDRFMFAIWSHHEIAGIYNQRRSQLSAFTTRGIHLAALEKQCPPQAGANAGFYGILPAPAALTRK